MSSAFNIARSISSFLFLLKYFRLGSSITSIVSPFCFVIYDKNGTFFNSNFLAVDSNTLLERVNYNIVEVGENFG